jgi:hypothetical protein
MHDPIAATSTACSDLHRIGRLADDARTRDEAARTASAWGGAVVAAATATATDQQKLNGESVALS